MSDQSQGVVSSIQSAVSQNQISPETGKLVLESLDDLAVTGCQGVNIDDIDSEDVTLVSVVIDASGSMSQFQQSVIDAYNNSFLKPLSGAKNASSILVSAWVFSNIYGQDNVRLVHGYTPVPECPRLTKKIYDPNGATPLNDAVYNAQTGIISYGQTLRDSGTRTKCIVVVFSDGEENCSSISASKVRTISDDLIKQEIYVLSYIFFGDEKDGDRIAKQIGFPSQHRITASLGESEIRRIFGAVSASVISASQTKISASSLSANAFFANP